MTVETTNNRINYTGDGATEDFAFTFKTFDENTIKVYEDNVLTVGAVTVSLNSNQDLAPGGSVNVVPAPAIDVVVSVKREEILSQGVDYTTGDQFPADTHEGALDKLTFIDQQQQDELDRTAKGGNDAGAGVDYTLPLPIAGKAIKWNATADGFENSTEDPDNSVALAQQAVLDAQAQVVLAAAQVVLCQAEVVNAQTEVANAQAEVALAAAQAVAADASRVLAEAAQAAAEAAQTAAEAAAAGVNLPSVGAGDAAKLLRVNGAETGFELDSPIGDFCNNENDNLMSAVVLDCGSPDLAASTWESVGPTGSGADHIWTALDSVPDGADFIEVDVYIRVGSAPAQTEVYGGLYSRPLGSVSSTNRTTNLQELHLEGNSGTWRITQRKTRKLKMDTNRMFELRYSMIANILNAELLLIGYGYNR